MHKLIMLFVGFLLALANANGQTKLEKEYRIDESKVPVCAREFVYSLEIDAKTKWYYEESLEGNSIEAKLDYQGQKYSVEFDTLGKLEDVEVEYEPEELSDKIQQKIHFKLDSVYTKYAIRKVQLQYSGDIPSLSKLVNAARPAQQYKLRYELVVKGRKNNQWKLYEITFGNEADIEDISQIIFRNTDILEY